MKKYLIILFIAISVLLMSCSKESPEVKEQKESDNVPEINDFSSMNEYSLKYVYVLDGVDNLDSNRELIKKGDLMRKNSENKKTNQKNSYFDFKHYELDCQTAVFLEKFSFCNDVTKFSMSEKSTDVESSEVYGRIKKTGNLLSKEKATINGIKCVKEEYEMSYSNFFMLNESNQAHKDEEGKAFVRITYYFDIKTGLPLEILSEFHRPVENPNELIMNSIKTKVVESSLKVEDSSFAFDAETPAYTCVRYKDNLVLSIYPQNDIELSVSLNYLGANKEQNKELLKKQVSVTPYHATTLNLNDAAYLAYQYEDKFNLCVGSNCYEQKCEETTSKCVIYPNQKDCEADSSCGFYGGKCTWK